MDSKATVATSTLLVMALTFLGYVAGYVVQVLMAHYLGAGKEVDVFVAASLIPEIFFGLTNAILFSSFIVFYPKFIKEKNKEQTALFISSLFTITFFCALFFACLIFLTAPFITKIIAPGFTEESRFMAVSLIRILSVSIFFFTLTSLISGILYHEHHFTTPKLIRIFLSLGIVFGIFLYKPIGIVSLAFGFVLGSILAWIMQYAVLRKKQYTLMFTKQIDYASCRALFSLAWPLIVTSFLYYLYKLIVNIMASTLEEGSIAVLNYAFLINNAPIIFFSGSLAAVVLPFMAKHVNEEKRNELKLLTTKAVGVLLLILTPITLFLLFLPNQLITILFERGAFTQETTSAVSNVLFYFALGIIPSALFTIFTSVLYSLQKTRLILGLNLLLLSSTVFLSLLFSRSMGTAGIALATSISAWGCFFILLTLILRWNLIEIKRLQKSTMQFLIATVVMALFLQGSLLLLKHYYTLLTSGRTVASFLVLISIIITSSIIYIFILRKKKNIELILLITTLQERIKKV